MMCNETVYQIYSDIQTLVTVAGAVLFVVLFEETKPNLDEHTLGL